MVTFNINKKNGNFLTRIDTGEVNNSAVPLNLIGEGVIDYGELIAESFVYLTENFASPTIPENSILGQLWYDTNTDTLNVVVNENPLEWRQIITGDSNGQVSNKSPDTLGSEEEGNLKWFSQLDQLYASDGDKWVLVGPQGQVNDKTGTVVLGFGNERLLLIVADGQLIGGYSDNFIKNSTLPASIDIDVGADILTDVNMQALFPNGFGPGFSFANGFKLFGTSTDSEGLNGFTKQDLDQIYLSIPEGGTLKGPLKLDTTGSLTIPVGTAQERPNSPTEGMIRFDTTKSDYEGWTGSMWEKLNGIPRGPQNERPNLPDPGTLRYNTTTDDLEIFKENQWEVLNATGFDTYIADDGSVSANESGSDKLRIFGGANIETCITGTTLSIDFTGGVINTYNADSGSITGGKCDETLNILGGKDIKTSIVDDTLTIDFTGVGGQPVFVTVDSDSGSTTANSTDDKLIVAGGIDIRTSICNDTLTIDYVGQPNLWATFNSDSGSTKADRPNDSLRIEGGTDIYTSINGDTLKIDFVGIPEQPAYSTITADSGASVATSPNDTLNVIGGSLIETSICDDTLVIDFLGKPDQDLFATVVADTGTVSASNPTDVIIFEGGTDIETSLSGNRVKIDFVGQPNLWATFTSDFGSTTADIQNDTLNVEGGTNVQTSITGDKLRIDFIDPGFLTKADPQLTGDFDTNGFDIVSGPGTNGDIGLSPDGTGRVVIDGLAWPGADGTSGQTLATDGNGDLFWTTQNLWATFTGDFGSTTADIPNDTLHVEGGTDIQTTITGDTLQIDFVDPGFIFKASPQLGGSLDVNGFDITSAPGSGGNVALSPDGSGLVVIDGVAWPGFAPTSGQTLQVDSSGNLIWTTQNLWTTFTADDTNSTTANVPNDTLHVEGGTNIQTSINGINGDTLQIDFVNNSGFITSIGGDGSPLLGGNLDVNGFDITTATGSNGNIRLIPDGSGRVVIGGSFWPVGTGLSGQVLTTDGTGNLTWSTIDQNIWATFNANSGSATASSSTDTLSIVGGSNIATSITGDVLTIDFTGSTGSATGLEDADGDTSITPESSPGADEDVLTFTAGGSKRLEIGTSSSTFYGDWNLASGATLEATYADIAERYNAEEPLEPGTIVCLAKPAEVAPTTSAYDIDVFGVVSGKPAIKLNSEAGNDETHPYIALKGRVQCKVSGQVVYGQRIVSSDLAGIGQAVNKEMLKEISTLCIIGRALEDKNTNDVGLIEITVE